jgi:nucleoside phosphorylase
MPSAVILTALPVEYYAVRKHLTNLREEMHPQGTIYERGVFAGKESWNVGIAEVGAGNAGTAVEAERAINYFKPDILLFVGIAGGIKDVAIGDVVVATKVYGYESGKADREKFLTRPSVGQSAYALVQRAKREAGKDDWMGRLIGDLTVKPRVFVAPIAAGEKVVAAKTSGVFEFLRSSYNDAIAVEMEGYGFMSAAFAYPSIQSIVIRGISDLVDDRTDDDKIGDNRQEKAAAHASAFAFEMLQKTDVIAQIYPDKSISQQEQRLGIKLRTLQSEWNLRAEKLSQLRRASIIESGVAVRFQLEQQILEEEKVLQELELQLNSTE